MTTFEEDLSIILNYAIAYNKTSGSYIAVIDPDELKKILIHLLQEAVDAEAILKQTEQYDKDRAILEA